MDNWAFDFTSVTVGMGEQVCSVIDSAIMLSMLKGTGYNFIDIDYKFTAQRKI